MLSRRTLDAALVAAEGGPGASTRSKESVAVELRRLAGVVRRSPGGCGGLIALVWSSRNKGVREEVVETVVGGG